MLKYSTILLALIATSSLVQGEFTRFVDEEDEFQSQMEKNNIVEYDPEEALEARALWVRR